MRNFKEELEKVLIDEKEKIKKLQEQSQKKTREFAKEFFEVGKRVRYSDRDGVIEGTIVSVDDKLNVAVMVDYCNGPKEKELEIFYNLSELSLI